MHFKVCIMVVYFGTLPSMFPFFLESCGKNPEFNWLMITDAVLEEETIPNNFDILKMTFAHFQEIVKERISRQCEINHPYKICDYKVAFGYLFKEHLVEYDFWGWSDCDVIFGNLSHFISDDVLLHNDKIYTFGHLTLMRNNDICINLFREMDTDGKNCLEAFCQSANCGIDEQLINKIATHRKLKVYKKIDFVDMDIYYHRIMCCGRNALIFALGKHVSIDEAPRNYKKQAFYYSDGRIFRVYVKKHTIEEEEFAYFHYRNKKPVFHTCNTEQETRRYWITEKGFWEDTRLAENPVKWISANEIAERNPYHFIEEEIKHWIWIKRIQFSRIKRK